MLYANQLKRYLPEVLASRGVVLDKRGRTRCPFHAGTNPTALSVRADRWRCFACEAHGDVVDFVMRVDGVGFAEALRRIAALVGMPVEAQPRCADAADQLNLARKEQRFFDLWAWRRRKRLCSLWQKYDAIEAATNEGFALLQPDEDAALVARLHERLDTARDAKAFIEAQEHELEDCPEALVPAFLADLYNDVDFRAEVSA